VIVRISSDGQYNVSDDDVAKLAELDHAAVEAVKEGDHDRFHQLFDEMLALVHERGTPLDADELTGSDVILPPADTTLAEAEAEFSGEGLIPG